MLAPSLHNETQQEIASPSGPAKNQQPISEDYTNNNHPVSTLTPCRKTYGREETLF